MLETIKKICQVYNIKPDRSKGQNFLVDQKVLTQIINTAQISPDDVILEVGPGLGILTQGLITKAKKVISVELDKKLFQVLSSQLSTAKNLELINQDILKFEPAASQLKDYKIVASLPYNITSIFLKKFLAQEPKPKSMTLLLQKEVAQRACALPGQMSLLSVSVQLYGVPKIFSLVGKKNFWPAPKIDSAIIFIDKIKSSRQIKTALGDISEKSFWQLVKIGFSARRKQLQNNLSAGLKITSQRAKDALVEANLSPQVRAQDLSVGDWLRLAKKLKIYLN